MQDDGRQTGDLYPGHLKTWDSRWKSIAILSRV